MKKRTISLLIFNGELTRRAGSKLARITAVGLLGFSLICGGISGCGKGDEVVKPTETEDLTEVVEVTEAVQVVDHYDGDSILFVELGTFHEGRVIRGVSEDEVLVRLTDGSEETIHVNQIAGTLIADHPDVGTEVVMLSERAGERRLKGEIIDGYTDSMRKIEFFGVTLVDDTFKVLDVPRIRFVHRDTDFEDGGYLTLDEFNRLFD